MLNYKIIKSNSHVKSNVYNFPLIKCVVFPYSVSVFADKITKVLVRTVPKQNKIKPYIGAKLYQLEK